MLAFARNNKLLRFGIDSSSTLIAVLLVVATLIAAGCTGGSGTAAGPSAPAADPNRKIKIGFSMATLKEERWQRDHDAFQAHCTKLNIECVITVANGDAARQANDVD
jgi:D-xylose transport system substrate-binding protein